jgi:quinol monooxygenase YgiN
MAVGMIVKLPAQEGKGEELVAVLAEVVAATAAESGTLQYVCLQDNANPDIVWMYEIYTDQAAIDAHMGGEVFQAAFPKLGKLLGGAPEFNNVTPRVGKGL